MDTITKLVKITKLSPNQVDRLDSEHTYVEDLSQDPWKEGTTFVETTYRMVEALYSRVEGCDAEDFATYGYDTTEAESDMVKRSALVSRESLSAKLAAALGEKEEAQKHRRLMRKYKSADHYAIMNAV